MFVVTLKYVPASCGCWSCFFCILLIVCLSVPFGQFTCITIAGSWFWNLIWVIMTPCVQATSMLGFSHLWLVGLNGYGMLGFAGTCWLFVCCIWLIHMCHNRRILVMKHIQVGDASLCASYINVWIFTPLALWTEWLWHVGISKYLLIVCLLHLVDSHVPQFVGSWLWSSHRAVMTPCVQVTQIFYTVFTPLVRLMCIERLTYLGVLELAGN